MERDVRAAMWGSTPPKAGAMTCGAHVGVERAEETEWVGCGAAGEEAGAALWRCGTHPCHSSQHDQCCFNMGRPPPPLIPCTTSTACLHASSLAAFAGTHLCFAGFGGPEGHLRGSIKVQLDLPAWQGGGGGGGADDGGQRGCVQAGAVPVQQECIGVLRSSAERLALR